MKIQMLRNAARSIGCQLSEGQIGEVDDAMGESLIKAGLAIQISKAEKVKGVAQPPEIKGQ